MARVRMFIEKFGREVVIDADHPLAAAQRLKDATASAGSDAQPVPGSGDGPSLGGEPATQDGAIPARRTRAKRGSA